MKGDIRTVSNGISKITFIEREGFWEVIGGEDLLPERGKTRPMTLKRAKQVFNSDSYYFTQILNKGDK